MSTKVVVAADGTVTKTDAVLGDIFSTAVSTDSAIVGTYGLIQRGGLVALGFLLGRSL